MGCSFLFLFLDSQESGLQELWPMLISPPKITSHFLQNARANPAAETHRERHTIDCTLLLFLFAHIADVIMG